MPSQLTRLFLLSLLGEEVVGLALSFTSRDTVTLFFTLLSSTVPADSGLSLLTVQYYQHRLSSVSPDLQYLQLTVSPLLLQTETVY